MIQLGKNRADWWVFGFYTAFFCIVFAAFPWRHSFIGNADVIVHTSYFYEHLQWLKQLLGLGDFGNAYYPQSGIEPFIESYWGQTAIFWFFKLPGWSDMMAIYGLYVVMFTLNAFALYLLSCYYGAARKAAVFGGIVFAASCYMFSTQEFMNGVAVFLIPLSMWFAERFFRERVNLFYYLSILCLVLESYFSAYHVFLGGLVLGTLFIVRWWKNRHSITPKMVLWTLPMGILLIPLFLKISGPEMTGETNPLLTLADPYGLFSIHFRSFLQSLPNNLLYEGFHPDNETAVRTTYRANLGILCAVLFAMGWFVKSEHKLLYAVLFIAGLGVAFGPYLHVNGSRIPMPLALLYKSDFFHNLFRMPGRAFIYCNLIIGLVSANAVSAIIRKYRGLNKWWFAGLLIALFSIENQAIPPYVSDHSDIIAIPEGYDHIRVDDGFAVIADLPSSLFSETGYRDGISEFTREYRYHYWQTRHHQHIINGSASFFPDSRMKNNTLMMQVSEGDHLARLIELNGLTHLVFHRDLILQEEEGGQEDFLRNSPLLREIFEDDRTVVFAVVDSSL